MKKTLFLSAMLATALCSSAFADTYTIQAGNSVTYAEATFNDYTDIDVYGTLDTNAQTITQNITLREGATLGNANTTCWGAGNQLTGSILLEGDSSITGKGVNFGGAMDLNGHTLTIKDMRDGAVFFRADSSITGTGTISVQSRMLQFRDCSNLTATGVTLNISNNSSVEIRPASAITLAGVTGTAGSTLKTGDRNTASTLKLAGDGDYTFAGVVTQNNTSNLMTIEHTGIGTQTFSGTVKSGTFLASAGTMKLTGSISPSNGVVSLQASGGTLEVSNGTSATAGEVKVWNNGTLKLAGSGTAITTSSHLNDLESVANIAFADGASLTQSAADKRLWMNGATLNLKNTLIDGELTGGTLTLNGVLFGFKDSGGAATTVNIADKTTLRVTGTAGEETTANGFIIWNGYGHTFNVNGSLVIDHKVRAQRSSNKTTTDAAATFNVGSTGLLQMNEGIDFVSKTTEHVATSMGTINVNGGTLAIGGQTTGSKAKEVHLNDGANVVAIDAETSTEQLFTVADNATVTLSGKGTNGGANNALTVNSTINNSTATLKTLGNVTVQDLVVKTLTVDGALTISGATPTTMNSLTLSSGAKLTLGSEAEGGHDIALTTTNLAVDGSSNLNANLVVNNGTMTFADGAILTMGCDVTIGDTVTVVLTDAMVQSIMDGNDVAIIAGVDKAAGLGQSLTFMGSGTMSDYVAAHESVYSLKQVGDTIYITPEPATATLSLLALAALAARRKRH